MTAINQKEYLKKYLGIGKTPGEKKKKKKEKSGGNRLKIIDDDVDVLISREIEDDIAAANEDAPQIVAVIDDRPISLQVDEKTNSSLWKPIGEPSRTAGDAQNLKLNSFKFGKQVKHHDIDSIGKYDKKNSSVVKVKQENYSKSYLSKSNSFGNSERDYDFSPQRITDISHNKKDASPHRRRKEERGSPARRKDYEYSPPGKSRSKSEYRDYSPPRRKNKEESSSPKRIGYSPSSIKSRGSDFTSPRKRDSDDNSPPRKKTTNDSSPPRRNRDMDDSSSRQKKNREDDSSPVRKGNKEEDNSPPRKKRYDDSSPRRRREAVDQNNHSPQRKKYRYDGNREVEDRDMSPVTTYKRKNRDGKKSRWGQDEGQEQSPDTSSGERMKKTLVGKRAGLQNAKDLSQESKHLRQREDELFKKMSAEISGRGADTVVRAKKVKDMEEEAAKVKRVEAMKEKYDRWGKGLKQVEDQSKRMEEQLHEMSKPLARYADDEDLEKFLKEQEREGDPMLNYIRKKKKKEKVAAGIPEKPMYMGEFMPNRFGIRPGFRWDGVDRSSGYEKKWFQVQNAKQASREEAFKWSTEDM